jgi:hypothetical protein
LAALLAACTTHPGTPDPPPATTPTPQNSPTMPPIHTLEQARAAITAQLSTIMQILVTAAGDQRHDPADAQITHVPCGDHGPIYHMSAVDGILIDPDRRTVIADLVQQRLTELGYTIDRTATTAAGGIRLHFHTDGYEATLASGIDNASLNLYLMSDCQTIPDGRYATD